MPKMRKIKMPASALEDADVQFISLVSRPANRIPFRITKADDIPVSKEEETEKSMFNLSDILTRKTDTDPASTGPAVTAVVIRKEDADVLIPKFKELGLVTDDQQEQGDALILKQEGYDEENSSTFKINDDVVIQVSDVQKQFEPFANSTNFSENAEISGFLPGLHMATETLFDTYRNILTESSSQDEAVNLMKSAIESYSSLVTGLVENLPEMAFKLEEITVGKGDCGCSEVSKDDETTADTAGEVSAETSEETVEKAGMGKKCPPGQVMRGGKCVAKSRAGEVEKEDSDEEDTESVEKAGMKCPPGQVMRNGKCVAKSRDGDKAEKEEGEAVAEETAIKESVAGDHEDGLGDDTEIAAKSDDEVDDNESESVEKEDTEEKDDQPDMAAMLASLKSEIMEGITGVQTELTAVKETADSLKERLDEVEEVAKAAETAVKGTVQTGSDAVDQSLGTRNPVAKSDKDDEMWGGVLDNVISG